MSKRKSVSIIGAAILSLVLTFSLSFSYHLEACAEPTEENENLMISQQDLDMIQDSESFSAGDVEKETTDSTDIIRLGNSDAAELSSDIKEKTPVISSRSAAVIDSNGDIVYSKNGDQKVKIASVTKTMTAIIASQYDQDTPITVSSHAASIGGSSAHIATGDVIALGELMKGLMLPSGNDAAYAIAEGCGRIMLEAEHKEKIDENACVERFVIAMNLKAGHIGMTNTLFTNPCGLDDDGFEGDHVSTAIDVAKMTSYAYSIPEVSSVSSLSKSDMFVIRNGKEVSIPITNVNHLLETESTMKGMKTGFTDAAGYCLSGIFDNGGKITTTSVLGSNSQDTSFAETLALNAWARDINSRYSVLSSLDLFENGNYYLGKVAAPAWLDKTCDIEISGGDIIYDLKYWEDPHEVKTELYEIGDSIKEGDVVGKISLVSGGGDVVEERDILASQDVDAPDFFEGIGIAFMRFLSNFTGSSTVADSDIRSIGAPTPVAV